MLFRADKSRVICYSAIGIEGEEQRLEGEGADGRRSLQRGAPPGGGFDVVPAVPASATTSLLLSRCCPASIQRPALSQTVQGSNRPRSLTHCVTLDILFFFLLFRAVPTAYGGSQARGRIRATPAGLPHSHCNSRSEPCLQPTPQLTAMPDP